jgi:hypothetical protein
MVEALGIIIDRRPKRRPCKMESQTIEKIGHLFSLSSPMQRRKGRQGDRVFVPPSLTVQKYRDSEGIRGKFVNRCLSLLIPINYFVLQYK